MYEVFVTLSESYSTVVGISRGIFIKLMPTLVFSVGIVLKAMSCELRLESNGCKLP